MSEKDQEAYRMPAIEELPIKPTAELVTVEMEAYALMQVVEAGIPSGVPAAGDPLLDLERAFCRLCAAVDSLPAGTPWRTEYQKKVRRDWLAFARSHELAEARETATDLYELAGMEMATAAADCEPTSDKAMAEEVDRMILQAANASDGQKKAGKKLAAWVGERWPAYLTYIRERGSNAGGDAETYLTNQVRKIRESRKTTE